MNKINQYFIILVLSSLGALLAVSLLGGMAVHIGSFEFLVNIQIFDHGFTEIRLPPLGSISAQTHQTPIKIIITLTNIDYQGIKNILEMDLASPNINQDINQAVSNEVRIIVNRFVIRLLLLASLGGGLAVAIYRPKQRITCAVGILIGVLLIGGLLYQTYHTYDYQEFEHPEFRGVLEAAPWMISFAQDAIVRVDELGSRMQIIAENLFEIYQTIDTLDLRQPLDSNLRVMHISDIHNNPAAFDFVIKVAQNFQADFIINTGDETDFGTPLESVIFHRIADLKIPYVFLGGNHDSNNTLEAMKAIENVIVLDNGVVELEGLIIAGFSDPFSKTPEMTALPPESIPQYRDEIRTIIAEMEPTPHIIGVHNHRLADSIVGLAPIIMHGHDHRVAITETDNSVILDAGTSGASGIRGLQTVNETPYSVLMIYFNMTEEKKELLAVDVFKVYNLRTGFTLERTIINKIIDSEIIDSVFTAQNKYNQLDITTN